MKLQHMYIIKKDKKMPLLRLYVIVFFLILSIYVLSTSDVSGINKESEVLYIGENKANLKYKMKIEDASDKDIKDSLGNKINKNVMLSIDDVKEIFDPNIQLIKSKGRVITTTESKVAEMNINSDSLDINGKKIDIHFRPEFSNNKMYIPLTTLKEIFEFDLIQGNKRVGIILKEFGKKIVRPGVKVKLKAGKNIFSGTLTQILAGTDLIYLSSEDDKVKVLTPNVSIGYINSEDIKSELLARESKEDREKEKALDDPNYKKDYNYITNYNNFKMNFDNVKKDNTKINAAIIDLFKISRDMFIHELYAIDNNGFEVYDKKLKQENIRKIGNLLLNKKEVNAFEDKITEYEGRVDLINKIISKAKKYKLDGINLDFSDIADKAALNKFVIELKPRLKSENIILTIKSKNPNVDSVNALITKKYIVGN